VARSAKYLISVPVWGTKYVDFFLEFSLASLLSEKNLGVIANRDDLIFLIHTTENDRARIQASPLYAKLSLKADVRFVIITVDAKIASHRLLSDCHLDATRIGADHGAAVVYSMPDVIYADGCIAGIDRILARGFDVIFTTGVRLRMETATVDIEAHRAPDRSISIAPSDLMRVMLANLHPIMWSHFWKEFPERGLLPSNLIWRVGDRGLLLHAFHLHPFVARPPKGAVDFAGTIDDDFIGKVLPDHRKHYVVQDSDEFLLVEVSASSHEVNSDIPKQSVSELLVWTRSSQIDRIHRRLITLPIRLHQGPMDKEDWRLAEAEARHMLRRWWVGSRIPVWLIWVRFPNAFDGITTANGADHRERFWYPVVERLRKLCGRFGLVPLSVNQHLEMGAALAADGRWGGALVAFRKALELRPLSAGILASCAEAALEFGNTTAAGYYLRRFEAVGTRDVRYFWLSVKYMRAVGDDAGVARLLAQIEEGDSVKNFGHLWMGSLYDAIGDAGGALRHFEMAKSEDPGNARVLGHCIHLHAHFGQLELALEEANALCLMTPSDVGVFLMRSRVLWELGKRDLAILDLEAATRMAPSNAEARDRLELLRSEMPKVAGRVA
jgi:Flp pilus assembly protein TadD